MADEITKDIAKNSAGNVLPSVLTGVIQQIRNVVELEEKIQLLNTDFGPMNSFLLQIEQQFREQQRTLPQPIEDCLTNMSDHLREGRLLINRANQWRRWCFGCCLMCNLNLFKQITDWRTRFYQLFQTFVGFFSLAAYAPQIVSGAAHRTDALLQPGPDFVVPTIGYAQMRLQAWLGEARPEARMIGVYGMGGIGKTTVLQAVYNNYKKVSGVFDVVIWVTVSRNYESEKLPEKVQEELQEKLQASIAETLDLKLEKISDKDTRKMKLYELLGKKKFLLILDDMWHPIDLIREVGVQFGDHNCSKVLMSSRSKEVTGMMAAMMRASIDYSLEIQTLSTEHGWDLFRNNAFTNGVVPPDIKEATARKIASECQGLPLALTVIAKVMSLKKTESEWSSAWTLMREANPSFLASHPYIDKEVYKRLKWSYDDLNDDNLKICFLYCAAFPEDTAINVETLVEMWSAEKSVATYVDAGQDYIDALVRRGLIEYVDKGFSGKKEVIKLPDEYVYPLGQRVKVHDVLRDLAIYIGRSEKCLFATGQHLQSFPRENEIRDCERISVGHNDIQDLSGDVISSELVSLVLPNNEKISKVPEGFLSSARSLKVLDLSQCISLTSLPISLGDLRQLEFLKLTGCYRLENLPKSTGNLSRLRFLKLQYCQSLKRLPDRIGELRNLNHLNLEGCKLLKVIPRHISHLTSLSKLLLPETDSSVMTLEHLANLSNLIELEAIVAVDKMEETVELEDSASSSNLMEPEAALEDSANPSNLMELEADVKSEIKVSTRTTWAELRRLRVSCRYFFDFDEEVNDFFPLNTENLKKLEYFHLDGYRGVSLSNCIYQFQNLTTLSLRWCPQLRELPAYEIGNRIVSGTFPMLKSLTLDNLERLESMVGSSVVTSEETMVGSSVVTSEETMPNLEDIYIKDCRSLKRLGKKKFPSLKKLNIVDCDEFETLVIESGDLPMLKKLKLDRLHKCQIIVGPSGVINDGVVPELQVLGIHSCRCLERLALGKLPNLRKISIHSCSELKELKVGSGGLSLPNLRKISIDNCSELKELEVGSDGLGFPMLESLCLWNCENVENMVEPHVVWNDETMPKLESLIISGCPLLTSLPRGIQNLSNLHHIYGELEWWDNLDLEDDYEKIKLARVFHAL